MHIVQRNQIYKELIFMHKQTENNVSYQEILLLPPRNNPPLETDKCSH